jgi:hypothetical protein
MAHFFAQNLGAYVDNKEINGRINWLGVLGDGGT